MLSKVLTTAVLATILSASLAGAQSLAQIGGPSNLPPAGFTGQQFVDSRGCVFLRAGFGATVNWVPRVDRKHNPLCGFPPSFGPAVAAAVAADMAPEPVAPVPVVIATPVVAAPVIVAPVVAAPAPVTVARPVAVAAVAPPASPIAPPRSSFLAMLFGTQPQAASPAAAPAQPVYAAADLAGPASGQIQCYAQAPKLTRVLLRTGGTALVCTTGDGSLTGWISPHFPRGAGVGASLTSQMLAGATVVGNARATTTRVASNAIPTPPAGYKLAWKDDRLNPQRGVGTAQGQAQQDQIWTRDVPAVLVADQPQPRATTTRAAAQTVTVSTMSAPAAQGNASYVQVGTFGQPANADGVKARLTALGLPVSTSKITRGGKVLQIVYAGPFGSTAAAQSALATARSAGFGDAILR